MKKITLTVTGMSCLHCEKAVVNALEDIGAANTVANAKENTVTVEFDPEKVSEDAIRNEIADVGYTVM